MFSIIRQHLSKNWWLYPLIIVSILSIFYIYASTEPKNLPPTQTTAGTPTPTTNPEILSLVSSNFQPGKNQIIMSTTGLELKFNHKISPNSIVIKTFPYTPMKSYVYNFPGDTLIMFPESGWKEMAYSITVSEVSTTDGTKKLTKPIQLYFSIEYLKNLNEIPEGGI